MWPFQALQRVRASWFETMGTVVAGLAWLAISAQIVQEIDHPGPSHLALLSLLGFLLNFSFWTIYGLRFARPAVWVGNLVSVLLQLALLVIVLHKGVSS